MSLVRRVPGGRRTATVPAGNRGVSVWAPSLYQYYSLKPILRELRERGVRVRVFCMGKDIATLSPYLGLGSNAFHDMPTYLRQRHGLRSQVWRVGDLLYQKTRVSARFSVMYSRVRDEGRMEPLLEALMPRRRDPGVNESYQRFFQDKLPDTFDGDAILAVTPVMRPYWLAPVSERVFTITESWDHTLKRPFLHRPAMTFTWNDALARDLREHQGVETIDEIYPLKFRYLAELGASRLSDAELTREIGNARLRAEVEALPDEPFVLYIATSSARNRWAFPGELTLVKDVADYARYRNTPVYIKPKPNGLPGEFSVVEGRTNVTVGIQGTGASAEDLLDSDYHIYRYVLLRKAGLVINVGTTFGLEAALLGVPILQLELGSADRLGGFPLYTNNPHIQRYLLLSGLHRRYEGYDPADLFALIDEGRTESFAADYAASLREWLQGGRTLGESVRRIADVVAGGRL